MERRKIVNLGIYRSGSTTLFQASQELNLQAFREFPALTSASLRGLLFQPDVEVREWWEQFGCQGLVNTLMKYDVLCDGWYALMVFLPPEWLVQAQAVAKASGLDLVFVCTQRESIAETVKSELHHWILYNLESKCNLSLSERNNLATRIEQRTREHRARVAHLQTMTMCHVLPLNASYPPRNHWSSILSRVFRGSSSDWQRAFDAVGKANSNPPLPVEGILLTMRVGCGDEALAKRKSVDEMLTMLEKDPLCIYFVTLGLDSDELDTLEAKKLLAVIHAHRDRQARACVVVANDDYPGSKAFPICRVWDKMASIAWQRGAAWVVLLGDDIDIKTECHYRCTYRAFLDIVERIECPEFFGCPWWNDESFPGFPTFPVVGKAHFEIFGSLIPKHRSECFVNQDLDPYLQRLYLSHGAAPPMEFAKMRNRTGGHDGARYIQVHAAGWKDFVLEDIVKLDEFLGLKSSIKVVDIGIPTYRLNLDFLKRLCQLSVPPNWRSTFIVIVDNPSLLLKRSILGHEANASLEHAGHCLEEYLRQASQGRNQIRVRVNPTNQGASASRNLAIFESSAEYILFLDDDVIPAKDLLFQYDLALKQNCDEGYGSGTDSSRILLGCMGMVRFPRSSSLPILHAGVLMSYLTFMFEISECSEYQHPAWGVTANILVQRRSSVLFDTAYAKTGGGEDVDFCLRLAKTFPRGCFSAAPLAVVNHPFWKGNFMHLCLHFFHWEIGDSGLFQRFPQHTFRSWPNVSEMMTLTAAWMVVSWMIFGDGSLRCTGLAVLETAAVFVFYISIDISVDLLDSKARRHRNGCLGPWPRSFLFLLGAHILAHLYILVLEFGRLWGHFKRGYIPRCLGLRFDWHCGRLSHHRRNLRNMEWKKFVTVLLVLLLRKLVVGGQLFPRSIVVV